MGQFLADCTIRHSSGQVPAADLYAAYRRWCLKGGLPVKTSTWFGKQIRKRDYIDSYKSGTVQYIGISLVTDREDPEQGHLGDTQG